MSMLTYLPWCPVKKPCVVAGIQLLPFNRDEPLAIVDDNTWSQITKILAAYRDINGNPIKHAALVQVAGKGLTDDLTPDDRNAIFDLVAIVCCCSLACRKYFRGQSSYSNADCFVAYSQRFDEADWTTLVRRQRDGPTRCTWGLNDLRVSVPVHCHTVKRIEFDEPLLAALIAQRSALTRDEWGKWQNAVACFKHANTDSENVPQHVEWVLLCSAFQHLFRADSKAKDVARHFEEAIVPTIAIDAATSKREAKDRFSPGTCLRYEWMNEFYRIRGDFAHGNLHSTQPKAWEPDEHLFLATLAFPLVLKSMLVKAGHYSLTEVDRVQIDCFEPLADTIEFLCEPPDSDGIDSKWVRLTDARQEELSLLQLEADLRKALSDGGQEL